MTAVSFKNIVEPCPPIINQTCTVQTGKNIYNGLAVQLGAFRDSNSIIIIIIIYTYIHHYAYTLKQCMVQEWDECSPELSFKASYRALKLLSAHLAS